MDAKEYIQQVALPSYETFKAYPTNYSKPIVAINSVPEHVAHSRFDYAEKIPRHDIVVESEKVRQQYPELRLIKDSAEALKHVRLASSDGQVDTLVHRNIAFRPHDLGAEELPDKARSKGHPRSTRCNFAYGSLVNCSCVLMLAYAASASKAFI